MKTKSIIFLSKSHWMCVLLMCVHSAFGFNNVSMLRSTTSALEAPAEKRRPGQMSEKSPESLVEMSPYRGSENYNDEFVRNLISYMSSK